MSDATLIDTLEFGSDEQKQKYEIYGDDAQTPTFAVISRQQEATASMGYGSGDTLPDLRDLPAEARERCERHWQEQSA